MTIRTLLIAAALTIGITTAAQSAPVLQVTNGILTGATGVELAGTLYDVQFVDTTCAAAFGGCTASFFNFTTLSSALAAGQALLDQVFIDGPAGNFDSNPTLTLGCSYAPFCQVLHPYAVNSGLLLIAGPTNFGAIGVDDVSSGLIVVADDLSTLERTTFAVWSPTTATVPEPASGALVGIGLLGAVAIRRRKDLPMPPSLGSMWLACRSASHSGIDISTSARSVHGH